MQHWQVYNISYQTNEGILYWVGNDQGLYFLIMPRELSIPLKSYYLIVSLVEEMLANI